MKKVYHSDLSGYPVLWYSVATMNNNYLVLGVVLVLAAGLFGIAYTGDASRRAELLPDARTAIKETDWVRGPRDAKVVLVEYSDFQCPACARFYPELLAIEKEYEGKIAFVYRHFPLLQIHKNAEVAGRASEAAGMQGKFWEMHAKLFENQSSWDDEVNPVPLFTTYAKEIGLDEAKFALDIESESARKAVADGYRDSVALGLNSTPSFYLNQVALFKRQAPSPDAIRSAINAALAE